MGMLVRMDVRINPPERVMRGLSNAFLQNDKLQAHIRFIMTHGALYKIVNGNLLYHGCIPMNEDGTFKECVLNGETYKGKAYMDALDKAGLGADGLDAVMRQNLVALNNKLPGYSAVNDLHAVPVQDRR